MRGEPLYSQNFKKPQSCLPRQDRFAMPPFPPPAQQRRQQPKHSRSRGRSSSRLEQSGSRLQQTAAERQQIATECSRAAADCNRLQRSGGRLLQNAAEQQQQQQQVVDILAQDVATPSAQESAARVNDRMTRNTFATPSGLSQVRAPQN